MDKPHAVIAAQKALWAWTAWICAFGLYQAWFAKSEAEQRIIAQLQEVLAVPPESWRMAALILYALVGLSMIWAIAKIGKGRRWARFSLLVSFIVEALWVAGQPGSTWLEYLNDVPDLGLQLYALYQLYSLPGRTWFQRAPAR